MSVGRLLGMDLGSHLLAAAVGAMAASALNGSAETVVKAVAGGASLGSAIMCVWELGREEPRWDEAAGRGAAYGALGGGLWLAHEIVERW